MGKLNSATNRSFSIDVYRNVVTNPSGYGEGKFYAGTVSVTTDGNGNAGFALTNNAGNYAGQYFTATATSAGGDTSEFGLDVLCTNKPAPSATFTGPLTWRTNGFVLTLAFQTNFTYRVQATTNLSASHRVDRPDQLQRHQLIARLYRPHGYQLPRAFLSRGVAVTLQALFPSTME